MSVITEDCVQVIACYAKDAAAPPESASLSANQKLQKQHNVPRRSSHSKWGGEAVQLAMVWPSFAYSSDMKSSLQSKWGPTQQSDIGAKHMGQTGQGVPQPRHVVAVSASAVPLTDSSVCQLR